MEQRQFRYTRGSLPRSVETPSGSPDHAGLPSQPVPLDQIYDRYRAKMLRGAQTLLSDPDLAQDAVQEVFLRAVEHRMAVEAHLVPWLFRVTRNLCLNDVRDDRRRRRLRASHPVESHREQGSHARVAVKQLLARVPDELQQIAFCYYVHDLSHEEIAPIFGLSRRTVGNRLAAFQAIADELFQREANGARREE
jgi:RNA polymerase sigma-70 factor (ECF subfamily)